MTSLDTLRSDVYDRDGRTCPARGVAVFDARGHGVLSLQHRINRGSGGATDRDDFPNLMTLCVLCNAVLEQDAGLAALARQWGWKLHPHEDPERVGVWHAGEREWRQLLPDGTAVRVRGRNDMGDGSDPFAGWRDMDTNDEQVTACTCREDVVCGPCMTGAVDPMTGKAVRS